MAVNRRLGVYQAAGTDQSIFAVISLWGKFGGLHTCAATFSYIVPLPNIFLTCLFSKLRLKRKDFQEILCLPWAQEVSGSNQDTPTKTSRVFSLAYLMLSSLKTSLWKSPRQEVRFANRLVSESSPPDEFAKTRGGRRAVQKLLNGSKLSARHLASMGKIQGTLCISGPINLRRCKSRDHALGPARASQRFSICRLNRPVLNRSDVFIRERQRRLLRHGVG